MLLFVKTSTTWPRFSVAYYMADSRGVLPMMNLHLLEELDTLSHSMIDDIISIFVLMR